MREYNIYVLEAQDNSGTWGPFFALNAKNPMDAWHESASWIAKNAGSFGQVWKLPNGNMNLKRWRVMAYYAKPRTTRAARRFKEGDLVP